MVTPVATVRTAYVDKAWLARSCMGDNSSDHLDGEPVQMVRRMTAARLSTRERWWRVVHEPIRWLPVCTSGARLELWRYERPAYRYGYGYGYGWFEQRAERRFCRRKRGLFDRRSLHCSGSGVLDGRRMLHGHLRRNHAHLPRDGRRRGVRRGRRHLWGERRLLLAQLQRGLLRRDVRQRQGSVHQQRRLLQRDMRRWDLPNPESHLQNTRQYLHGECRMLLEALQERHLRRLVLL